MELDYKAPEGYPVLEGLMDIVHSWAKMNYMHRTPANVFISYKLFRRALGEAHAIHTFKGRLSVYLPPVFDRNCIRYGPMLIRESSVEENTILIFNEI